MPQCLRAGSPQNHPSSALCTKNQSFLGSPDHRLLFILVCVPRVVQKSASTNLSRGLYMNIPASRKTMVSNTNNIEVRDRHARHRWGTYKCALYTNLPLEGKAGSFNRLPRFQRSLQRTKTLILKPGKRFTWIYRNTLRRWVCYSLEYFQNFLNFKRSLVLKTWWADKFYYCFELRAIYNFYSFSSAASSRCHIFKTRLQSIAIFAFCSKLDLKGRKSAFNVERTTDIEL